MKVSSVFIIVALLFTATIALPLAVMNKHVMDADMDIQPEHQDITYAPHLVKFYIYPKQEGIGVSLWASDNFPMTSGKTDNNSCVIFSVDSSVNYFVTIPQRNISIMLVPVESEYHLVGGIK